MKNTTSNHSSDPLYKLIHSLTKSEKRSFKLYARRNSSAGEDMKFLQLFDHIEKSEYCSDEEILKKNPGIKKSQISNIKAHLYKQLLTSLRLQNVSKRIDYEIREEIDYANILYQKGLYQQALKILDKAKAQAEKIHADILLLEIYQAEKNIESQHVISNQESRLQELTDCSTLLLDRISRQVYYSNVALQLNSLYMKVGFIRDEKDYQFITEYLNSKVEKVKFQELSVDEKVYLCNIYVRYYYMIQDFAMCYRYAKYWVDTYDNRPLLVEQNQELYLKSKYYLLLALFMTRSYQRFVESLDDFIAAEPSEKESENVMIFYDQYKYTHLINRFFLEGTFSKGLELVPEIDRFIEKYEDKLDANRISVLNYKIACLYFGSGDNKKTIHYLNKVIQIKSSNVREDHQCFARILNLIAHFELGNDDLVEYQVKSVYRYLSKMGDLQGVQQEIILFIRQLSSSKSIDLKRSFRQLLAKLKKLSQSKFEKRPFMYLDIISWLEAKIEGRKVQEVIREKFLTEQQTGEKRYFPEP